MREVACALLGWLIGTIIYLVFTAIRDYRKESLEEKIRDQVREMFDEYGIEPKGKLKTHYVKDF